MDYSGLIGGISGVAGNLLNYGLQDNINDENIDNQWQMFRANQRYQNDQNLKMYSTLRKSLEGAGLNINSAFGGYPTTTAPSSSMASKVAPAVDSVGIASLLQQAPLVNAQARKENADAEAQEIENKRKHSEDAQYDVENAIDAYNQLSEEDKVKQGLPNIQVVPRNKGWFEAHRNFNQFKGEQSDVSLRQFSNTFNELIVKKQMANPKVLEALENMPYRQYESIIQQTNLAIAKASESKANKEFIDANKAYIELKKELEEDGNIFPYISKIFEGSFDFEDFVKCLVLVGIKVASR